MNDSPNAPQTERAYDEPRNLAKAAIAETPITTAFQELANQIAYLDEVSSNLGLKLDPVRNSYPSTTDKGGDEPTPSKSTYRQIIDGATEKVKTIRMRLETISAELEI